ARNASRENPSAGQRPITSDEMFAAAAAQANASIAPATPAAPNVDASGITSTRARPFRLNQSRASNRPSLSGEMAAAAVGEPLSAAAPANNSDEKSGVGPDIWSGARRCTTSDVSSSALTAASLASAAVLTVAASPY